MRINLDDRLTPYLPKPCPRCGRGHVKPRLGDLEELRKRATLESALDNLTGVGVYAAS